MAAVYSQGFHVVKYYDAPCPGHWVFTGASCSEVMTAFKIKLFCWSETTRLCPDKE